MSDLDDLATEINAEHAFIAGNAPEQLQHAIRCGELLIEAKKSVPKGEWVSWLDQHVTVYRTTAFKYIRLAKNKDAVQERGVTGIDPAIELLQGKRSLTPEEKQEIVALSDKKVSHAEIARMFGIQPSTVSYHTNAKDRNRTKTLQKRQRLAERRALEREEQARAVRQNADQLVADAYALMRKAEQKLGKRLDVKGLPWTERRFLSEALDACFKAEDAIGSSLRGAEPIEQQETAHHEHTGRGPRLASVARTPRSGRKGA